MKKLEIWADSFHEGVWCCDNICSYLTASGYSYTSNYLNGFIPHYIIKSCICLLYYMSLTVNFGSEK